MRLRARRRTHGFVCLCGPAVLALALCAPALFGERWHSDTAHYTAIALKCVREGHWFTLMLSQTPYFNKPPVAFWIHAFCMAPFADHPGGPPNWSVHLPEVLALVACVVCTSLIARRLAGGGARGARAGLVAGALLATLAETLWWVDSIKLDWIHSAFMLMGVSCMAWAFGSSAARGRAAWTIAAGLSIGLAMLTKPIWGIGALGVVLIWVWVLPRRERVGVLDVDRARASALVIVAACLALLIASTWHVFMYRVHGESFTGVYFGSQIVERARGQGASGGGEPWDWYVRYLFFPPGDEPGVRRAQLFPQVPIYAGLCAMCLLPMVRKRRMAGSHAGAILALVWCAVWFVSLSAFSDKRPYYLLHIYPLLCVGAGTWLALVMPRRITRLVVRNLLPASLGVGVALAAMSYRQQDHLHSEPDLKEQQWSALADFVASNDDDETFSNGSMKYRDVARLYVRTGTWPRIRNWSGGMPDTIDAGTLVLYDARNTHNARLPRPIDAVVTRFGRYLVVRAGQPDGHTAREHSD